MNSICVFGDSVARGVIYDETKEKYTFLKNSFINSQNQYKLIYNEFDKVHRHFQSMVSERTDSKKGWGFEASQLPYNRYALFDFFKITFVNIS